jgi:hypothetical protein
MSAKVLVNDATPIDVLQMAVLAAAHEADWRRLPTLAIVAFVFKTLWRLEILEAGKSATVWRVASDGVAGKPAGENSRLDAWRDTSGISTINRRCSQFRRPVGNEPSVILEALMKEPSKSWFFDGVERACPEHLPMIEPLNEH